MANTLTVAKVLAPANTKIVIAGAGGIGARLIPQLVKIIPERLKPCTITVIDPALVREHNLLRQPYVAGDVGIPKAWVMRDRYDGLVAGVTVRGIHGEIGPWLQTNNPHMVIGCADGLNPRIAMLRQIVTRGRTMAYIDIGNDATYGQVALSGWWSTGLIPYGPDDMHRHRLMAGWMCWPDVFMKPGAAEAQAATAGCGTAADSQTPISNLTGATVALHYISTWLTGGFIGSVGARWAVNGGVQLEPIKKYRAGTYSYVPDLTHVVQDTLTRDMLGVVAMHDRAVAAAAQTPEDTRLVRELTAAEVAAVAEEVALTDDDPAGEDDGWMDDPENT